jgi:hypothetical protein
MNKTLLLVICDFLLLNLLALTRWEKAEPARPVRTSAPLSVAGASTTEKDLVETMRLSLADEEATRGALAEQLANREQSLAKLESDRNQLAASLDQTKKKAVDLDSRLLAAQQEAEARQARLAKLERDLELKEAETARQHEQYTALERAHREASERIENLSVAVKVAEKEKLMLKETTETLKQQVDAERQERQKVQETSMQLAQGVGQLAVKSGELTQEIRENRPINANVLFSDFLANRVTITVRAEKPNAFLGPVQKSSKSNSVLVTDGKTVYALLHINETPLGFNDFSADWSSISVSVSHGEHSVEAASLQFIPADPRIVALPIDAGQVAALGCKVYPLSQNPLRFSEAMLVSRGGEGYGESPFKLESAQASHVRMDNRFIKKLVGEFTPSRGDLVFSKSGDFLGIMASSSYCALVPAVVVSRSITLGDTRAQITSKVLSEMEARLRSMPFSMQ